MVKFSSGVIFLALGILFAFSGLATNYRIKKFFPPFYNEHKCMLNFATLGLTIPLLIRGSLDIVRFYSKYLEKLIHDEPALYSVILLMIGDIIPLGF